MEFIGYFLFFSIGVLFRLIGGGGSILAVPIMVYIIGIEPILATAYSLFIVGFSAVFATISNLKKKLVNLKVTLFFALPSLIAVYFSRSFLLPAIPQTIQFTPILYLTKEDAIILLFALLMLVSSVSMLRNRNLSPKTQDNAFAKHMYLIVACDGLLVGILTGMVGAGGGFLIVPVLILMVKLPIKIAIGTSLSIIALKSLFGFIGDLQIGQNIDWNFLLLTSTIVVAGIFAGGYLSDLISEKKLKKGFGWFLLLISSSILIYEFLFK